MHRFVHEMPRDRPRWGRRIRPGKTWRYAVIRGQRGDGRLLRDGGDERRMAHNPEVEGSNPSPATKMQVRSHFSNRERASFLGVVNGFANGILSDRRQRSS